MNKKTKTVLAIVGFVAFVVAATVVYQIMIKDYEEKKIANNEKNNQTQNTNSKRKAADFKVQDKEGQTVQLSEYIGKPVVINLWATWCGYCLQEMPDFNESYNKYKDRVQFMMVNATDGVQETKEKAMSFVEQQKYQFPIYFDTNDDIMRKYKASGIPLSIFVDKEGNIAKINYGYMTGAKLESTIESIL